MKELQDSLTDDELPDFDRSLVLLKKAQGGDQAAFGELLQRYEERLRRIVRVRMGVDARRLNDSMDIVQDTYRVALRKLKDFEPRDHATLLAWLSTIAVRQVQDAADRMGAAKRDPRREARLAPTSSAGADLAASQTSVAEGAWRSELREILDDVVSQLSEDYREVILLRDYAGAQWDQVAETLGRPTTAAAKQLHQRAWIRVIALASPRLGS